MDNPDGIEISVVIPVYGSADILRELHRRIVATVAALTPSFEIILVNDASPDHAWQAIVELASRDSRVRGLNLSRNFGQYPAITAGLTAARGEWVVVMDCDLQDQPEAIAHMYEKAHEGYAVVVGSRQERHDSFMRRLFSRAFYATLSYLTGRKQDRTVANFGMYHRKVIDAVLSLQGHMRYFSVMVRWVGFRTAMVPVVHAARKGGKTGYSFRKLFGLATDIILAYSDKPLRVIVKIGAVVTAVAALGMASAVARACVGAASTLEFMLASLWLIFGMLLVTLGVIALYLGKTFDEVKKRPIYIIEEEI